MCMCMVCSYDKKERATRFVCCGRLDIFLIGCYNSKLIQGLFGPVCLRYCSRIHIDWTFWLLELLTTAILLCPVYDFDAHEQIIIQKPDRPKRLMWTCNYYRCGWPFSRCQFRCVCVSLCESATGKQHRQTLFQSALQRDVHFVGGDDKSDLMIGYSFGFSCLVIKVKGFFWHVCSKRPECVYGHTWILY